MNLELFQTRDGDKLRYSQEQASRFAKEVAGDFNPLHDVGSRRFCVPGDLLFVTLLSEYGVAAAPGLNFPVWLMTRWSSGCLQRWARN